MLQAERAFVVDVHVFNWMKPMPQRQTARDEKSDQNANEEEQAIRGQTDEQNHDHSDGRNQGGGPLQAKTEARPRHIKIILTPIRER